MTAKDFYKQFKKDPSKGIIEVFKGRYKIDPMKFAEAYHQHKLASGGVLASVRLSLFEEAAKKQKKALEQGGWGHAIWCNYQRPEGNGEGRCNCGIVDLQTALNSEA